MEIGASAITFLMGTWQNHLTPNEGASMAEKEICICIDLRLELTWP